MALPSNPKIGIAESDLEDYTGMFLKGTTSDVLEATFAPYPLEGNGNILLLQDKKGMNGLLKE